MFDTKSFIQRANQSFQEKGYGRKYPIITRDVQDLPYAMHQKPDGSLQKVSIWCSNDYLELGSSTIGITAAISTLLKAGCGAGGSRYLSGNSQYHIDLEKSIAHLHDKEEALLFSSGFLANYTALKTLLSHLPNAVVFSDEYNHSSMICGISDSKCEKYIFKHNNVAHLRELIAKVDINRPKVIAFESLYSMTGITSNMKEIIAIAKEYGALTYLDEVHSVGLYGAKGGGIAEELGLQAEIDIIQGSLGKTFGSLGGYIAASRDLIYFIKSKGSGFIFTTPITPSTAAAALAVIEHLKKSEQERNCIKQKTKEMRSLLRQKGILPAAIDSQHFTIVMVGNKQIAKQISDVLLEDHQIYLPAVIPPTVPEGEECFRITVTPSHTDAIMEQFVEVFAKVKEEIECLHIPIPECVG